MLPQAGADTIDAPALIVWLLRLVVPCILFWISFGPRISIPWPWTGPTYSREVLLRQRKAVPNDGIPHEDLATLKMVDEQTAPFLFQDKSKKEPKEKKESKRDRDEDGDAADRRQSREERRSRKDRPQHDQEDSNAAEERLERQRLRKAAEAEEAFKAAAREKQMHLESLINFVAFNKYKQQRVFLFDDDFKPPPPPHKPPHWRPPDGPKEAHCLTVAAAERANAEAQMVLNGAVAAEAERVSVTKGLFHQLTDMNVDIAPLTFELMVEACIQARHLPAASDFLMRMESCGHAPGNNLLDRVMELYLLHKKEDGMVHPRARSAGAPANSNNSEASTPLPLLGPSLMAGASSSAATLAPAPNSMSNGVHPGSAQPPLPQHPPPMGRPIVPSAHGSVAAAPPPPPNHAAGVHRHMGAPVGPMGPASPPPPHSVGAMGMPPGHLGGPPGNLGVPPPGAMGGGPMHHGHSAPHQIGHNVPMQPMMMHGGAAGVMPSQGGGFWHEDGGVVGGHAGMNVPRRPGNALRAQAPLDVDLDAPVFAIPDECSKKQGGKATSAPGDSVASDEAPEASASSAMRADAAEFVPGEACRPIGAWNADALEFKPSGEFRTGVEPIVPTGGAADAVQTTTSAPSREGQPGCEVRTPGQPDCDPASDEFMERAADEISGHALAQPEDDDLQ